jgi:hypothetical protein
VRFEVVWNQTALDNLATAWTLADSAMRQDVTHAAQEIDRLLESDPNNQGESRASGQRILFVPPLGVAFEVDAEHSLVQVLFAWSFRRHGQA